MCESVNGSEVITDSKHQYNPKDIIFTPNTYGSTKPILIIKRESKSIEFFIPNKPVLYFAEQSECSKWCYKFHNHFDNCIEDHCSVPKFVRHINCDLLRQINGITAVDSNGGQISGHLLLFNINGKPMFCFTQYGKDLSNDVIIE